MRTFEINTNLRLVINGYNEEDALAVANEILTDLQPFIYQNFVVAGYPTVQCEICESEVEEIQ